MGYKPSRFRYMILCGSLILGSCGSDDKNAEENDAIDDKQFNPGALLLTLDNAMGSVGFTGQESSALRLADSEWVTQHCKSTGSGVKEAYQGQEDIEWGCKFAVATDGPDTPRGGLQRVKSLACSLDKAIAAGEFAFDETTYNLEVAIDAECWGESFSQMVAEQLPDKVNADGYAEGVIDFTGYETVPESLSTNEDWDRALIIDFGKFTGEVSVYTMLMNFSDEMIAASILESAEDRKNAFGMSLEFFGGEDDLATFRYVGRFVFGPWGDGSGNGSRHLQTMVTGPYTGDGTFSAINSGSGFEAEDYGNSSGAISIFEANTDGLMTKNLQVLYNGTISEPTSTWSGVTGTTAPTGLSFDASATQLKVFLSPNFNADYTASDVWHRAAGPYRFESVSISAD